MERVAGRAVHVLYATRMQQYSVCVSQWNGTALTRNGEKLRAASAPTVQQGILWAIDVIRAQAGERSKTSGPAARPREFLFSME